VVGLGELAIALALPTWLAWAPGWAGVATAWVALAYVAGRPGWLGKRESRGHALPTIVALLPFFLFARGCARVFPRLVPPARVEIVPGLWVGGWPRRGAPDLAHLDVTAELPHRGPALRYACVPMLDGAPPAPGDYHRAVTTAVAWRREGLPVLVHCAYGHGRSVAVCIGVLLAEGRARTWEEAHAMILAVRPRARMTPAQRRLVAAESGRWRAHGGAAG
jgi:hypothetical protein